MNARVSAICDIGCKRANNEDMAYVAGRLLRDDACEEDTALDAAPAAFAVADGMGGCEGGEVASEIVCRSFAAFMRGFDGTEPLAALKRWATDANNLVNDTAAVRPGLAEMGSTFVGLVWAGGRLWLVNVGDSRCYRLRGGVLKQLSVDHSERERTGNPDVPSNLIYNFMGNDPADFISDITELTPIEGDVYLLCSDGLSDMVDFEDIEANADDAETLVDLAKQAGGRDNITIVRIQL